MKRKYTMLVGALIAMTMFSTTACEKSEPIETAQNIVIQEATVSESIHETESESETVAETNQTQVEEATVETTSNDNLFSNMDVEEIFNTIYCLYGFDLDTKESLGEIVYGYNGIYFLFNDSAKITASMKKSVNSFIPFDKSYFYNKMAMCVEAFSAGNNWEGYIEHIIGFIPENREECSQYMQDISSYIVVENPIETILAKICSLENASKNDGKITITSISGACEELGISNEMFAYILHLLDSNKHYVFFDGDTCVIE